MKSFDKRTVPGLEDCSSDSNDEDEIPFKRTCKQNDIEVEAEMKQNDFLIKEPATKLISKAKKFNNVWGNIVQENILDESFNRVGVNKMNVSRNVESYSTADEDFPTMKRKHARKNNEYTKDEQRCRNIKERIESRSYDKSKDRSHILINLEIDSQHHIVSEIARLLKEPKLEMIEKCIVALGKEKLLEFYYMTEDIEDHGGLLVMSGTRRRTAGGVFLSLIKDSEEIDDESKRIIFHNESTKRASRRKPGKKIDRKEEPIIAPETNNIESSMEMVNNTTDVQKNNDENLENNNEELEEGEIM